MTLHVISSSSKGNSYALVSDDGPTLLVEAGVPYRRVLQQLPDGAAPVATVVSHRHGDHAAFIRDYLLRAPLYCNADTAATLNADYDDCHVLQPLKTAAVGGGFSVTPFDVRHDVPSFGYLIYHREMGTLLFVTDTYLLPFQVEHVSHFLIEANYDEQTLTRKLQNGDINRTQAARIAASHMSLQNCIRSLRDCDASHASTITLCHLSSRHADPVFFRDTIAQAFGVPTYVASPAAAIPLTSHIP